MAAKNLNPDEPTGGGPSESPPDASASESPADASPAEPSATHPAERAVDDAQRAADAIREQTGNPGEPRAIDLPDLGERNGDQATEGVGLALLRDVNLQVKVELGRTRMYVEDVLRLNEDSVIELDKLAGDPVDIYVNDRYVARGEVLVVNDSFCVRVSEIIQPVGTED